jgi:predicted small metal-binding protein
MAVTIDCGKVNPASGCGHIIHAENEEEALRLAAEHARTAHGLEPTPELMDKVRANIQRG